MFHYRAGWPAWKLAVKMGLPIKIKVKFHYDKESQSFWAESDDLEGLVVTGANPEELHQELVSAASTLIELEVHHKPPHVEAFGSFPKFA